MPNTLSDIFIRLAKPEDKAILVNLYFKLLEEMDPFDYEILPTLENAEFMVQQVILPGLLKGDAVLIAFYQGQAVGLVAWNSLVTPLKLRVSQAVEQAIYVSPSCRGLKLSSHLREKAKEFMQNKVQTVVTSPIQKNTKALKNNKQFGFKSYSENQIYFLK